EQLPRGQTHHTCRDTLASEKLGSPESHMDLAARRDENHVVTITEDIAASRYSSSLTVEYRNALPGLHDGDGPSVTVECHLPRLDGFGGIGRSDHPEIGHSPQRCQVFDRLMGGPVFSEEHRVVGPDPNRWRTHQSRQTNGRTHVVAEHEESSPIRTETAMHCDAVGDGAHDVFADPEF